MTQHNTLPDGPVAATHADVQAVARLVAAFDRRAQEDDLETFVSSGLEDVVFLVPDQAAIVGRDALRTWYRGFYDAFEIDMTHHPGETLAYGNLLIHRGTATGTLTPAGGGSPASFDNKYMFVLLRVADGSLKLWRAAFNANAPSEATHD